MKTGIRAYWDIVADTGRRSIRQRLLRTVSDRLNRKLFVRWMPPDRAQSILKTDAFDESLTDGLYPLLSRHAGSVISIDVSPATIRKARSRHGRLSGVAADVRRMPFPSGTFDIVLSNSTLDHHETTADIIRSLHELRRVLREDGELFLSMDNCSNPWIFLRNALPYSFLNRLGVVPYYIGKSFTAPRLRRTLERLGFSVKEITAIWHFPRILLAMAGPLAHRCVPERWKKKLWKGILRLESLSESSAGFWTGQFIAARAVKRS